MTRRNDPPPRTAWTVPEVAASLGVSSRHVYRLAESGELRTVRIGRRVLVPVAALNELLATAS